MFAGYEHLILLQKPWFTSHNPLCNVKITYNSSFEGYDTLSWFTYAQDMHMLQIQHAGNTLRHIKMKKIEKDIWNKDD